VIYRILDGYKYELAEPVIVQTGILEQVCQLHSEELDHLYIRLHADGQLFINKRYAWDGASGIPDNKNVMRASLVHDALYQLMREGLLDREFREAADDELRQICLEDGVGKFSAWCIWKAVRLFAEKASLPEKKPRGQIVEI